MSFMLRQDDLGSAEAMNPWKRAGLVDNMKLIWTYGCLLLSPVLGQ